MKKNYEVQDEFFRSTILINRRSLIDENSCVVKLEDWGYYQLIIPVDHNPEDSTLYHECLHVAMFHLRDLEIEYWLYNCEEILPYYVEYLFKKIKKEIQK